MFIHVRRTRICKDAYFTAIASLLARRRENASIERANARLRSLVVVNKTFGVEEQIAFRNERRFELLAQDHLIVAFIPLNSAASRTDRAAAAADSKRRPLARSLAYLAMMMPYKTCRDEISWRQAHVPSLF